MKRAVKLQRREMKKEIKRLEKENDELKIRNTALSFQILNGINRNNYRTVACTDTISSYHSCFDEVPEKIKDQIKKDLARKLGEFLFNNGLCEVQENNSFLGLEIRMIYRYVQL